MRCVRTEGHDVDERSVNPLDDRFCSGCHISQTYSHVTRARGQARAILAEDSGKPVHKEEKCSSVARPATLPQPRP